MSYVLELDATPSGWDVVDRLVTRSAGPECVSLVAGPRRRWFRATRPSLGFDWDQGQEVLDEQASWDEDEFTLSGRREALARTVLLLAEELEPGWTLRSYWVGDQPREEARLSAAELADRIRRSALSRYVVYRTDALGEHP